MKTEQNQIKTQARRRVSIMDNEERIAFRQELIDGIVRRFHWSLSRAEKQADEMIDGYLRAEYAEAIEKGEELI